MNRQMAHPVHTHDVLKGVPCAVDDYPPRSLSEWLLLGAAGIVLAGVLWALLWALFVGLGAS